MAARSEIRRIHGVIGVSWQQHWLQARRWIARLSRLPLTARERTLRAIAVVALIVAFVGMIAGRVSAGAADRRAQARAAAALAATAVPVARVPVLTRVNLKAVATSAAPQLLPVIGESFEPGMSVRLAGPMERMTVLTTFGPEAVEALTAKSFAIRAMLDEPGTYTLTVRNKDGELSNTVAIVVKKARD